jgi:ribonucleoside-triphosphate reductase (thioredoxin)
MNQSNQLLSDLVSVRSYSKYIPHFERRELLEETINRTMSMHLDKFPKLSKEITKAFSMVHQFKVMPSMRSLQFSGPAILKNNIRSFNCSFTHIKDSRDFAEILFILLSGAGVGFSVQKHHINVLSPIKSPRQEGIFVVQDSIAGWAQALHALMDSYFYCSVRPIFDFSSISAKGTQLHTTGAKAPGSEPLKYMLETVEAKLKSAFGRKLRPIEVYDIVCIVADCVLAGGIRRSSLICLFDRNDKEMLKAKSGNWYELYPYRARANNSAILPRKEVTKEEFLEIFKICKESNSGEPGFAWTNDVEMGSNPCFEIALNSKQFCNLTIVNQTGITSKKDFLSRIYSASFLGTLQAAYTDFPYISQKWTEMTEREALLGVSFTGIADSGNVITNEWLNEGAELVLSVNEKYAKKLGINLAARTTCVKPEGTSSCVLGSSSGIHSRKSKYYLRRVQINKDDALYLYLLTVIPDLIEDAVGVPNTAVITIPQESPNGAILEDNETALDLFNRAINYNKNWVAMGHRSGANRHNVSCTISVKKDEWDDLAAAMWKEREHYYGMSLYPKDEAVYKQPPFEPCSEEVYNKYNKLVKALDLTKVKEFENNTNALENLACGGGACEITYLK